MAVSPVLRRALLACSVSLPDACGHPAREGRLGPDAGETSRRGRGAAPPPAGVVRPPAGIDPGIGAPAPMPNPRTTPVIPPPGTPGGDPRVQPR